MSEGAITFDRKWRRRGRTIVRVAALGGLFAGGALIVGELLGPTVARHIGESGGEGFAQGVARVNAGIDNLTRGRRFI
jgi:hypothetical protein